MTTKRKSSIPLGYLWAPQFSNVDGDRLRTDDTRPTKRRRPRSDLLKSFCRIAESPNTEKAVITFVKQCGLIGLCRHGLPTSHNRACMQPVGSTDTIPAYKTFAVCLESLGRIGQELNAGNTGSELDWELADKILSSEEFAAGAEERMQYRHLRTLDDARTNFMGLMRRLVEISRLQPRLHWDGEAWAIDFDSFGGSNLAALLTIQLMAQVGGKTMKKCPSCPRWFEPSGRQVYCSSCGIRAAWRAAARRRRQRASPRGKAKRVRKKA